MHDQRQVHIGIVGLRLGQWHVETIAGIDGARVHAVAENNPSILGAEYPSVQAYGEKIGAKIYEDGVKMILEDQDLDAVSLCVSPKWRKPLLEACAQRGLPTLVEKPWASNMAHARDIASVMHRHESFVMVEFPIRYMPAVVKARELLENGSLGKPYVAAADLQMPHIPPEGHWAWDPANGNGLINENTCHIIDTVCFLLGDPVSVYAAGGNFTGMGAPQDDAAVMTVAFRNGSAANISGGGLSAGALGTRTWLNVYTEHGQVLLTGESHMFDTVSWARRTDAGKHEETWPMPPWRQIMTYSLRHFVDCVRNHRQPSCGVDEGLRALAVCMGVKESIEKNAPIPLSW